MKLHAVIALALALVACSRAHHDEPQQAVTKPEVPLRDAVGDHDMRALVADLASSKACEQFEHNMRGMVDDKDKTKITGVLWIRQCKTTLEGDGMHVTFELGGNGWQWNHTTKHQAGGTFEVDQWVKFGVDLKLVGALDIAYSRPSHVVTLWFTPDREPDVKFTPIGDVSVDPKGAWSSIVGGMGSVFGKSPDREGKQSAQEQGEQMFSKAFHNGFAITVDLCTSTIRFTMDRPKKGEMAAAPIGQTMDIAAELQPNGVMMFGPYADPKGMSIDANVEGGAARLYLACVDQAEAVAQAFLDGKPNAAKPLAAEVISGKAVLRAPNEHCKVAVVARSLLPKPVMVRFRRPTGEATRAAGGPFLTCGKSS
ncbi:MAG TPA: hypothetical protein VH143_24225 [Kofleriaceae bacterium]|jgi:hypothetical protein|nr:hypothetical protein [Kofleriaceae bacterium]